MLKASTVTPSSWYNSSTMFLNRVAPSLVHDYAKQRYYNSADGETSFPFTATRTTNAMQFDSQGRAVWAPANMLLQSEQFDQLPWNVVRATVSPNADLSPFGTLTADRIVEDTTTNTRAVIQSLSSLVAGTQYTVSVYAKAGTRDWINITLPAAIFTSGDVYFDVRNGVIGNINGGVSADIINVGNGWFRCSATKTATTSASGNLLLYMVLSNNVSTYLGDGTGYVSLFGAQLELTGPDSPKSYAQTTSSAYYGPRFDYNPATGEALGLLVEEARTNLVPTSFNLTTATMSNLATTNVNSPSTYLGGWSAVRYTADGANTAHGAYPTSLSPTASSTVNMQAIIKPISANTFYQLTASENWLLDLNGYANFNLTGNGSVTATGSSASSPFIRHLGNGIYHIGVSVTTSAAPTSGGACIVGVLTTGTDARLPANTSTDVFDFIYGAVFQSVSGWCSIVPTFGTSVTKGADTISRATGSWLQSGIGSMYIDASLPKAASLTYPSMFAIDDNTGNNRISIYAVNGSTTTGAMGIRVDDSTVNQVNTGAPNGVPYFSKTKSVFSYATNNSRISHNGGTIVSDTICTIPTSLTTLKVMMSGIGWISEIRYYSTASATDAQLKDLTT